MPKKPETKAIEEKLFVNAYLENGLNATEAALAIKPHLTHKSAGEIGSRLLERVEATGAIDAVTESARDLWISLAKESITQLHAQSSDTTLDPKLRNEAHKLLIEYGKILAPASQGPKTAIQNNKYMLPKR